MIVFPNAKINIGIDIIRRRTDGYHDIETVFYPIRLYEALEALPASSNAFTSSGLPIPGGEQQNLCLRAYALMAGDLQLPPLRIHLHKAIPIGAGLGGGSSDAAFFIRLVNEQFNLRLHEEQMRGYARMLGSDCAFFIADRPAFASGRGDELQAVALDLSRFHIALVMPPVHVSTASAYSGVMPAMPVQPLRELIGRPVADWKGLIHNQFEPSVFRAFPQIAALKEALYDAGAVYASMSGSGASVFGIFEKKPDLSFLLPANLVFYDL